MFFVMLMLWTAMAESTTYLQWAAAKEVTPHPEQDYHFLADLHARIAPLVEARPGVVAPFVAGRTVQNRPIWGFRITDPGTPVEKSALIFAGIHALEWIGVEAAILLLEDLIEYPVPGVSVVVVPVLNVDRRLAVEADLRRGDRKFRRSNANGVDLNRDFAVHRESTAIWRHVLPRRYTTSPAPLSQPESQTIDALAAEGFDVAVSLHSFGGYLYYPWAGHFSRPADWEEFLRLGRIMQDAQGRRPYRVQQLSHWGFFFRALGAEIDHLYGEYGTLAFLFEMSRTGIEPLHPDTWFDPFRRYNPRDPQHHARQGFHAMHALIWELNYQLWQ